MTTLSTEQVAQRIGISRVTLERWLASGKVPAPKMMRYGRNEFRKWTARDVQKVHIYKQRNYRKGRGRKRKTKQ